LMRRSLTAAANASRSRIDVGAPECVRAAIHRKSDKTVREAESRKNHFMQVRLVTAPIPRTEIAQLGRLADER
jgi:hypothetical protein